MLIKPASLSEAFDQLHEAELETIALFPLTFEVMREMAILVCEIGLCEHIDFESYRTHDGPKMALWHKRVMTDQTVRTRIGAYRVN